MRLIDADELIEHVWRDKLDSRELIAEMVNNAPTVKEIPTNVPISIFEELISKCVEHDLKAYSDGANEVLDKIRAEIENHCGLVKENHCKYCSYCNSVMGVREIIEIIDRYKSEGRE